MKNKFAYQVSLNNFKTIKMLSFDMSIKTKRHN